MSRLSKYVHLHKAVTFGEELHLEELDENPLLEPILVVSAVGAMTEMAGGMMLDQFAPPGSTPPSVDYMANSLEMALRASAILAPAVADVIELYRNTDAFNECFTEADMKADTCLAALRQVPEYAADNPTVDPQMVETFQRAEEVEAAKVLARLKKVEQIHTPD
jgi:hypothetical protein